MNKYLIGQTYTIPLVTDEVPAGRAVNVVYGAVRQYPERPDPLDPETVFEGIFEVADNPTGAIALTQNLNAVGRKSVWLLSYMITDVDGKVHGYTDTIIIEALETLVKGVNSFQSYYQAVMTADEMPGMDVFKNSTKDEQVAALATAYRTIGNMTFASGCKIISNITSLTAAELDTLDPGLLEALCIAQVIEANESLDQNSIENKRLSGLMSETIGESSMMFQSGKVAKNAMVSRRSLGFLRNYLVITARIERV